MHPSPTVPTPSPRTAGRRANSRSADSAATSSRRAKTPRPPAAEAMRPLADEAQRHQIIAIAAYHRYQARGGVDGSDLQDWLEAEAQIDEEAAAHATAHDRKPGK